jgi:CheY-like chemotaxis protein
MVRDDGCGMDKATLDRVFEPFFTTKAPGQGVGLGLSVVHGIMQNHGGAITVYSEPGKGTAFHLYFPAAAGEAAAEPGPMPAEVARASGERVLFVDDEEALVFLAERTLQRMGYRVSGHTDPLRALEAFRSQPGEFDVVVTDLSMPGMSGADLARALLELRPDVPIVMTSGYVRAEDVESARRLGIRAVILKPNTVEELGATLHALLNERTTKAVTE